jgi:hypothetical protein
LPKSPACPATKRKESFQCRHSRTGSITPRNHGGLTGLLRVGRASELHVEHQGDSRVIRFGSQDISRMPRVRFCCLFRRFIRGFAGKNACCPDISADKIAYKFTPRTRLLDTARRGTREPPPIFEGIDGLGQATRLARHAARASFTLIRILQDRSDRRHGRMRSGILPLAAQRATYNF